MFGILKRQKEIQNQITFRRGKNVQNFSIAYVSLEVVNYKNLTILLV